MLSHQAFLPVGGGVRALRSPGLVLAEPHAQVRLASEAHSD